MSASIFSVGVFHVDAVDCRRGSHMRCRAESWSKGLKVGNEEREGREGYLMNVTGVTEETEDRSTGWSDVE